MPCGGKSYHLIVKKPPLVSPPLPPVRKMESRPALWAVQLSPAFRKLLFLRLPLLSLLVQSLTSIKSTVTCFRSPSRTVRPARILSVRGRTTRLLDGGPPIWPLGGRTASACSSSAKEQTTFTPSSCRETPAAAGYDGS